MSDNRLGIFLGTDASLDGELFGSESKDVYWHPLSENSPHLAITGSSGTGKTETLKRICFELKKKGIPDERIFYDKFT